MKLDEINWLYMGLSCAESMAVPVCLGHCCYLASQSNDIYTGIPMLIQGATKSQASFLIHENWLAVLSRVCEPESGATEAAVLVESDGVFVVWWTQSFCCWCKSAGKE